jgi:hypothetical protein
MESSRLSKMLRRVITSQGATAKRRICGDYSLGSFPGAGGFSGDAPGGFLGPEEGLIVVEVD